MKKIIMKNNWERIKCSDKLKDICCNSPQQEEQYDQYQEDGGVFRYPKWLP